MSSPSPCSAEPAQIIEGEFLDQRKLMTLLRDVYGISSEGENNFRVEVIDPPLRNSRTLTVYQQLRLNRYKIYPSEHLSSACTLTEVTKCVLIARRETKFDRIKFKTADRMQDGVNGARTKVEIVLRRNSLYLDTVAIEFVSSTLRIAVRFSWLEELQKHFGR